MHEKKDFKDALTYVFVQFTLSTSAVPLIKSFHFMLTPKDATGI